MRRSSRTAAAVATLALAVGLMGCTAAQKGAGAGGVLGAAAGTIIGHNSHHVTLASGAAAGAGAGAALGGLTGDAFAETNRKDLERELENLTAQLQTTEGELMALRNSGLTTDKLAQLDQLQSNLNATQGELDSKRQQLAELESSLAAANSTVAQKDASLAQAQADLQAAQERLSRLNNELSIAQTSLRDKEQAVEGLRSQLKDLNVELEETSRGLTLTIVNQLLYKPGSAELSDSGRELLGKVADIIRANYPDRELVVEGHTDNQPIVHSGWGTNWELGAARALAVVHEMVGFHGFDANKMSATSFGEFRPANTNATPEGRAANRRAVIVILPEKMPLQRNQYAGL